MKLVFLFALALFVRLYGLSEHSLFADEITWMTKGKEFFFAFKQLNLEYFNHGPWLDKFTTWPIGLPMSLLSGAMLVFFSPGQSSRSLSILNDITAARIPTAVMGALFIPIFYLLVGKFVGKKIALVSALLLTLDSVNLGLSRWVGHDLMLMVVSFLSLVFFLKAESFKSLLLSSFFASLAILSKPQGGVIVPSLMFYILAVEKNQRKTELIKLLKWMMVVTVLTILFFPFLWDNPLKMFFYLKTQTEALSNSPALNFLGQISTQLPWYYYLITVPFHLTETVLIGIVSGLLGILISLKNKKAKFSPLIKISLIYSLLFFLTISWSPQKLGVRYALPIWPYICLLAGYGLIKISNLFHKNWRKIYWLLIFAPVIVAVVKFYPSFYLYHNLLISPSNYQKLESVGFCDGIKPAMEFLRPKLHEGIKLLFYDCNFSASYYTGYTINFVYSVEDKPEYIIVENYSLQKTPEFEPAIIKHGYYPVKEINFRGIKLAKIYAKQAL